MRAHKVLVHCHIIQLVHFVLCHLHHMPRQSFKCWRFSFTFLASRVIFPSVGWLDSLFLFQGQDECEPRAVLWLTFCSATSSKVSQLHTTQALDTSFSQTSTDLVNKGAKNARTKRKIKKFHLNLSQKRKVLRFLKLFLRREKCFSLIQNAVMYFFRHPKGNSLEGVKWIQSLQPNQKTTSSPYVLQKEAAPLFERETASQMQKTLRIQGTT